MGFFEGIQQWGLSFEVDTPPQLAPDTVVCNNVLLVNGPPGYHTYQWSDGSSGPLAVIDTSGTYTVTTTDFFGCTGTDSIAVSFLDTVLVGQVMTKWQYAFGQFSRVVTGIRPRPEPICTGRFHDYRYGWPFYPTHQHRDPTG